MSEHLKRALEEVLIVRPMSADPQDIKHLSEAIWHLVKHLESQPQTPSESLSAPTTGPAERPSASLSVNPDLRFPPYLLTVQTLESSRSIAFTQPEWEATREFFWSLRPISGLPTTSGESAAGSLGVAGHD